jgi:hypothetical protein
VKCYPITQSEILQKSAQIKTAQDTHTADMQTTATQTANRTSPYQTRSKTAADMMDENELLHAQLDLWRAWSTTLEARVNYPVIFRRDLDDPGRHGEGAMDAVFAGDVDYPVIMRVGKWHDGRLTEQTEVLPDCVSDEIAVLAGPGSTPIRASSSNAAAATQASLISRSRPTTAHRNPTG